MSCRVVQVIRHWSMVELRAKHRTHAMSEAGARIFPAITLNAAEKTKKLDGEPMEMQLVSVEDLGPTGNCTRLRQFTYFLPEISRTVRVRNPLSSLPPRFSASAHRTRTPRLPDASVTDRRRRHMSWWGGLGLPARRRMSAARITPSVRGSRPSHRSISRYRSMCCDHRVGCRGRLA